MHDFAVDGKPQWLTAYMKWSVRKKQHSQLHMILLLLLFLAFISLNLLAVIFEFNIFVIALYLIIREKKISFFKFNYPIKI